MTDKHIHCRKCGAILVPVEVSLDTYETIDGAVGCEPIFQAFCPRCDKEMFKDIEVNT